MNIEQIEKKIEECQLIYFGENWKWRKGQKEAIIEIIQAYYNNVKTVIFDAPTGSGKSCIGMVVAWILNQENKKGFILTSDISLQEQYESDFKKSNFLWGSIKGIDNYVCIDNMEKNSLGTCRIRNIIPNKMNCYGDCPYFIARDTAINSPTSLLNYAYWLIMMNYVYPKMENDSPFKPRNFTVCDEAHKILDIIQNHYSPRFDEKTLEKIEKLTQFFNTYKIKNHIPDYKSIKGYIEQLFNIENQEKIHESLLFIENLFKSYLYSVNKLKDKVNKDYPKEDPPKEWRDALYLCDWLKDLHCKIEDFNDIIQKTSNRNIVKNSSKEKELIFNCLEESYMIHKYFHQWTGFTVLMSATFADASKYLKSLALNSAKYIKMDSNFNFDKSPIYFYNKRKMSWNKIEENLPWMVKKIDEILNKHQNESGIIHTASYDLALKIFNGICHKNKKRILVYSGTEEKRQVVQMLKVNKDKILMGPSLIEGLDLKDDWSRFAIFAKVPYLSLSDKFVSTKLQLDPDWYREKAILNILQGVGRSVRNENDWAITYILDGSLSDLLHYSRKSFPYEFLQRIVVME